MIDRKSIFPLNFYSTLRSMRCHVVWSASNKHRSFNVQHSQWIVDSIVEILIQYLLLRWHLIQELVVFLWAIWRGRSIKNSIDYQVWIKEHLRRETNSIEVFETKLFSSLELSRTGWEKSSKAYHNEDVNLHNHSLNIHERQANIKEHHDEACSFAIYSG